MNRLRDYRMHMHILLKPTLEFSQQGISYITMPFASEI